MVESQTAEPKNPDVVVVGAGVGGLAAALALGRQGRSVLLVERDDTPPPADAADAFAWDRRGAPQVRHSHAFLARLRNLLRDRWPDVLEQVLAAGATELRFAESMPETIEDRAPVAGDDDLVGLACRRTTLEWVLRRAALAEDQVALHHGEAVVGLVGEPRGRAGGDPAPPPTVTGVRLAGGDVLAAPLVVVAGGRRGELPAWFAELGAELPEKVEDTGIVYLSRFFRLRPGAEVPVTAGLAAGDLGFLKYGVFPGDDRTFSLTLAVPTHDVELRRRLLEPDAFLAAARAVPATAAWADADRADPTTDVHVMGGLVNRRRWFLDQQGEPRVLGVHAVGDAHTCTNPLYGRGCSLAVVHAALLADADAAHPDDPRARALAYEAASAEQVLPWYRAAVAQDRDARAAAAEATAASPGAGGGGASGGGSGAAGGGATGDGAGDRARDGEVAGGAGGAAHDEAAGDRRSMLRSLVRDGLLPASRVDPVVFRATVRSFNLLEPPQALVADAEVTGRVLAVWQARDQRPPEPPQGPERAELLALLP